MKPGRELDALIETEVMGRPGAWHEKVRINDTWVDVTTWVPAHATPADPPKGSYAGFRPPRFSRDISAAWKVVEKLIGDGGAWDFCSHEILPNQAGTVLGREWWSAEVVPDNDATMTCGYGEADTAPHAICLAAMKAVL